MERTNLNRAVAVVLAAGFLLTAGCPAKVNAPKGVAVQSDAVASAPLEMRPDVKELAVGETLDVPYILWGGDVATFMANGGETTQPGTTFAKHGLKFKLVRGDDFAAQVKNYKDGKTPFLRGTLSML